MTVPLTMPRLGETVTEGTIIRWLKQEGEFVEKDESIVEVSTAKVETDIPSPVSGKVSKILVEADQTVPVGAELALIEEAAAPEAAVPAPAAEAPAPAVEAPLPAAAEITPKEMAPAAEIPEREIPEVAAMEERAKEPAPPAVPAAVPGKAIAAEIGFISPIVRKLAREHNVDLAQVKGTGAGGRITKQDILDVIEAGKPAAPAPAPAPAVPEVAPPAAIAPAAPKPAEAPAEPGKHREPIPVLRREIAQHMVRSRHTAAHVTAIVEVDMTNIVKQRAPVKDTFKAREGFSLTYLPFVAKATIDALVHFPTFNASIIDEHTMELHDYINLGIAVAIENGLIVPVIKGAEEMSLLGLAREIHELADKARANKLSIDDVTGSTFTITNPGSFGSIIQTPIINQPNVAILSLEAIQKRPVVIDDAIAIRQMVYMPLSYDHRLVDGALAAQFLNRVKHNLETWDFTPDLSQIMED